MGTAADHILVRGVNWLGDAVMTIPALQRLRESRPDARVVLLTPAKLEGLWRGRPFLDGVITFQPDESVWQVGRRLRREGFTWSVAFPNSVRSALELWLAGIPRRVGYARPGRSFFLTAAIPPRRDSVPMHKRSVAEVGRRLAANTPPETFPAAAHHIHNYLLLTAALGASAEPCPPRLRVGEPEMENLRTKFRLAAAPDHRPWFGLNAGAEYGPAKRWPARNFAEAAVRLQRQTQCRWLVFGGHGEMALAKKLTTEIRFAGTSPDDALNLAGKTDLAELAAALKLCRLVLTNDTGPMHLAAAVGAPVVALFGSTSPELTGPVFSPAVEIVRNPVACAPCFRRECPLDLRCLNGITVDQVVAAAMRLLGRPPAAP